MGIGAAERDDGQDYFDPGGIATATEGCKSNALMRCCKDLGVASELWYFPGVSLFLFLWFGELLLESFLVIWDRD